MPRIRSKIHPTANIYNSHIGAGTKVAAFVEIGGSQIGSRCKIQAHVFIPPGVTIEDDVFIGPHACFTNSRFPSTADRFHLERTVVMSGAAVGAGAVIGPGVTIGRCAMIEMGAVVSRDVPDHHLYRGTPRDFTLCRWYRSQAEIGLPMTFDQWRTRYDRLSYAEHRAFHQAVCEKFPSHCNRAGLCESADDQALRFCAQLPPGSTVLQIGGVTGRLARRVLEALPVDCWHNYEISRPATETGLVHPRYRAVVPPDFVWNLQSFPSSSVLIALRVFEQLRASNIDKLLDRLGAIGHAYVEAQIPEDSQSVDWTGRWNTHILEIGWKQLEALFARHRFAVTHRAPDVRWFRRAEDER